MLEEILASGFEALQLTPDPQAIARYRIYYDYLDEQIHVKWFLFLYSGTFDDSTRLCKFVGCYGDGVRLWSWNSDSIGLVNFFSINHCGYNTCGIERDRSHSQLFGALYCLHFIIFR